MAGAGYLLFTAGQVLTAAQVNTYLMQQSVMVFATSAARDTALLSVKSEGMMSYQLDNNDLDIYNGVGFTNLFLNAHGALTGYTPTLTQSVTVTKTVGYASYTRLGGRQIIGNANMTATGSGTAANSVLVGLPVTAAANQGAIGCGYIFDTSAGQLIGCTINMNSTTTMSFVIGGSTAAVFGAIGLAAGDGITLQFCYEAAADA